MKKQSLLVTGIFAGSDNIRLCSYIIFLKILLNRFSKLRKIIEKPYIYIIQHKYFSVSPKSSETGFRKLASNYCFYSNREQSCDQEELLFVLSGAGLPRLIYLAIG